MHLFSKASIWEPCSAFLHLFPSHPRAGGSPLKAGRPGTENGYQEDDEEEKRGRGSLTSSSVYTTTSLWPFFLSGGCSLSIVKVRRPPEEGRRRGRLKGFTLAAGCCYCFCHGRCRFSKGQRSFSFYFFFFFFFFFFSAGDAHFYSLQRPFLKEEKKKEEEGFFLM